MKRATAGSAARALPFLAASVVALALPPPAVARQADATEAAEEPDGTTRARTHASPRDAMRAFQEGMAREPGSDEPVDLDLALSALDTVGTRRAAADRAEALWQVSTRVEGGFDLDELLGPDEVEVLGGAPVWTAWTRAPLGEDGPRVELAFVDLGAGGWKVARTTLSRVEAWADALRDVERTREFLEELPPLERWKLELRAEMPEVLLRRTVLIENWQWLGLLALVFLGVVLERVSLALILRAGSRMGAGVRLPVDREALSGFQRPFGFFVVAGVFKVALPVLGLGSPYHTVLDVAAGFVLAVFGVWAAIRLVDLFAAFLAERSRATANRFDDMLVPLVRRTLKIVVCILGLVYLASHLTEELWGVIAGLSAGSIAVGFAAQDSIQNLFGTFTVLTDKPFELGDWILVGDIEGTVEEVGFRSTRIRTFHNSLVTVPNRRFIGEDVDNMGKRRYRRIRTTLSLTYDSPPAKIDAFCEGVRELVRRHPYTRKDSFHVYLNELGAHSLDVLLYCFLEAPDWATELREKHRLFNDVLRVAERVGVAFAFPTQTIHLAKPEDAEHPDVPPDETAAQERGRAIGAEIVERTLAPWAGAKPPPVDEP